MSTLCDKGGETYLTSMFNKCMRKTKADARKDQLREENRLKSRQNSIPKTFLKEIAIEYEDKLEGAVKEYLDRNIVNSSRKLDTKSILTDCSPTI